MQSVLCVDAKDRACVDECPIAPYLADNARFFEQRLPSLDVPLRSPWGAAKLGTVPSDTELVTGHEIVPWARPRGVRRSDPLAGDDAPDDLTTRLLGERVWDRPMTDDELVSLLRNWTVGELSTISASVGILAQYLAVHPATQQLLRDDPSLIGAANDEILRLHAPLIANRRVTTRPVDLGGRRLGAGERITVIWVSADRDEAVVGNPTSSDSTATLRATSCGQRVHVRPGAPLARLELRVLVEELLARSTALMPTEGAAPARANYPGSGFASLPLVIH